MIGLCFEEDLGFTSSVLVEVLSLVFSFVFKVSFILFFVGLFLKYLLYCYFV